MSEKKVFYYEGKFNPSEILFGLKKIQNEINQIGVNENFSKDFTKQINSLQKRLESLQAKKNQGFTSQSQLDSFSKELVDFEQKMENLTKSANSLQLDFNSLKLSDNVKKEFDKINTSITEAKKNLKDIKDQSFSNFKNQFDRMEVDISPAKINKLIDASDIQDVREIQTILSEVEQKNKISVDTESIDKANKEIKRLRQELKEIEPIDVIQESKLKLERQRLISEIEELKGKGITEGSVYKQTGERRAVATEGNPVAKQELVEAEKIFSKYKDIENKLEDINDKKKQNIAKSKDINEELQKQKTIRKQLQEDLNKNQQLAKNINNLITVLTNKYDSLTDEQKKLVPEISKWIRELEEAKQKIVAAERNMEELRFETEKVANQNYNKIKNGLEQLAQGTDEAKSGVEDVSTAMGDFSRKESFFDNLKNHVGMVFDMGSAFNYTRQAIQYTYNTIKDLDAALTEISVVTDMTNKELWNSFDSYNSMAQQLGITTKDAIETSALYYQQGLDTADVMELTEETIKMARIAGMDFANATDRMTAAIHGFKLEMQDASRVNDVFSALAAKSAVDTDELSYALTKTASIAQSAGMELETTSVFLSQMIETTREAPVKYLTC